MTQNTQPSFLEFKQKIILLVVTFLLIIALLILKDGFNQKLPLDNLARRSISPNIALQNGKPTVFEFYADWCEACKKMAPAINQVETKYTDKIDVVMLNVDNTKWKEYIDKYEVNGIPHLSFFDNKGKYKGNSIGIRSKKDLEEIFESLVLVNDIPDNLVILSPDRIEFRDYSLFSLSESELKSINPKTHG